MPARKYKIDPDQLLAGGREILEQSAQKRSYTKYTQKGSIMEKRRW